MGNSGKDGFDEDKSGKLVSKGKFIGFSTMGKSLSGFRTGSSPSGSLFDGI